MDSLNVGKASQRREEGRTALRQRDVGKRRGRTMEWSQEPRSRLSHELEELLAAIERRAKAGREEWAAMVAHGERCDVCDDEFCDAGAELATAWRRAVRRRREAAR